MRIPKGFTPCSVSGEYVEGFWEIAFACGDQGKRTIRLRVDVQDIDELMQVLKTGSGVLKYKELVKNQERLRTKQRRTFPPAIFNYG